MANSVCLPDASPTQATLALHPYIISFWNLDDSRIKNLPIRFWVKGDSNCEQGGGRTSADFKQCWVYTMISGLEICPLVLGLRLYIGIED